MSSQGSLTTIFLRGGVLTTRTSAESWEACRLLARYPRHQLGGHSVFLTLRELWQLTFRKEFKRIHHVSKFLTDRNRWLWLRKLGHGGFQASCGFSPQASRTIKGLEARLRSVISQESWAWCCLYWSRDGECYASTYHLNIWLSSIICSRFLALPELSRAVRGRCSGFLRWETLESWCVL